MSVLVTKITEELLSKHEEKFVCNQNTDLVVEGFPRSGNTFSVDFLFYLNKELKMAHHTHDFRNLLLGAKLGVPSVVLVRSPLEAICSYMIFSGRNTEVAANFYYEFYSSVKEIKNSLFFIKFEEVVSDMNSVIIRLNERYNLDLQKSEDVVRDSEIVKERNISRARKNNKSDEQFIKTVGAPSKERDLLKGQIKDEVIAYLADNPQIIELYEEIILF